MPLKKNNITAIGYASENSSLISRAMEASGFGHSTSRVRYYKPASGEMSYGQYSGNGYSPAERYARQVTAVTPIVASIGYAAYQALETINLV